MYPFEYHLPQTQGEALSACQGDSRYLAGGQSLVQAMKLRLSASERLVDLRAVPGLDGITCDQNGLTIGAMVRHAEVARSPLVHQHLPALADLAAGIGDPMVRSMGTRWPMPILLRAIRRPSSVWGPRSAPPRVPSPRTLSSPACTARPWRRVSSSRR
jgi:hypothetical protein